MENNYKHNHFRIYKDVYVYIQKAVLFNDTMLRLCKREGSQPWATPATGIFLQSTRWIYPSRTGKPLSGFRLHFKSPESPDQIHRHFQGMNQVLPGPWMKPEAWLGDGRGCGQTGRARGYSALHQVGWYHRWTAKGSRPWARERFFWSVLSSGRYGNSRLKPCFLGHYEDTGVKGGGITF